MGSSGLVVDIERIGDGDPRDMFYELKEALLESVWYATTKFAGFASYLKDESFHVCMSDSWRASDTCIFFAFWEDGYEGTLVDFAVHAAKVSLAKDPARYRDIAKRSGFELDLARYTRDAVQCETFVKHAKSTRICRIARWTRGRPIDAQPEYLGCSHGPVTPLEKTDLTRARAAAMLGWCACRLCKYLRTSKDPLTARVAKGWEALDADPTSPRMLAPEAHAVLGDWFEERGIELDAAQVAALAKTYAAAANPGH